MKKWTALLIFLLLVLDLLETCSQVYHFDSCNGTFVSLVAVYATRAVLGLLHGVSGDEAEDDGSCALCVEVGNALCGAGTHIIKVRSIATYYAAECDDCIDLTALNKFGRSIDELKAAGNGVHDDVFGLCAVAHQCLLGAVE